MGQWWPPVNLQANQIRYPFHSKTQPLRRHIQVCLVRLRFAALPVKIPAVRPPAANLDFKPFGSAFASFAHCDETPRRGKNMHVPIQTRSPFINMVPASRWAPPPTRFCDEREVGGGSAHACTILRRLVLKLQKMKFTEIGIALHNIPRGNVLEEPRGLLTSKV